MKKILISAALILASVLTFAQCSLPSYTWQANKNRFVITAPAFTPDVYRWQWSADGITWVTKDAKLHAISAIRCPGNSQTCTYTVGVVQNTYSGALWYGVQDGWLVRFARKCSNGTWSAFSASETVSNVQ